MAIERQPSTLAASIQVDHFCLFFEPQRALRKIKESRPREPGFDLPREGVTKSDPVSPVSAYHSPISYQLFEHMNRRTAEQGTAECRSEKHCLIPFNNFCCSKFLVRYSIFKIQNRLNPAQSVTESSALYNLRLSQLSLTTPIEDPATRGRRWFSKDKINIRTSVFIMDCVLGFSKQNKKAAVQGLPRLSKHIQNTYGINTCVQPPRSPW